MITRTVITAGGGDYVSLAAAETGEDGSMTDDITFTCHAGTDTSQPNWAGWTANGFQIFVTANTGAGFDGVFTATSRYLIDSNNTGGLTMVTHSNTTALTVTYKNIQFRRRGGSSFNFRLALAINSGINTVYLDGCYLEVNGASQALPTNAGCLNVADASNRIVYARNTVFRCPSTASNGVVQVEGGAAAYINNCVVDGGGGAGIGLNWVSSGTLTAKNTVVFNCSNDVNGTVTLDYCATDDNDGTNAVDLGDNSTSWNTCFTDYANLDYTIKDSSAPIYGTGTDLSGDANYAVTTDIAGTARPQGAAWDIGISELVAGGVATNIDPSFIPATAQVFGPTLIDAEILLPGAIAATSQIFQPAIDSPAVVDAGFIASTAQVFAPGVGQGVQTGFIASTATVPAPTMVPAVIVQASRIESAAQVFAPNLGGADLIDVSARVESGGQVFGPTLVNGVLIEILRIETAAAVYQPMIQVGLAGVMATMIRGMRDIRSSSGMDSVHTRAELGAIDTTASISEVN